MGIFGKKKTKAEEEEKSTSEKDKTEGSKTKAKKIRDLNPENKKRRREPVRAWNKADRMVILVLILSTFGLSFYFTITAKGFRFPNLVPQINIFSDKTIELRSSGYRYNPENVVNDFKKATNVLKGEYGFYVIDLTNKNSFGFREGESFQAASLIKLPVIVGMYMEEEEGSIDLDSTYTLQAKDKLKGSGSLYGKAPGYKVTYRELIKLMAKESDNTAFNICRKYLGDEKIGKIIEKIGMPETSLEQNSTTPEDVGIFFRKLYEGELIMEENIGELITYMTDTIYEDWLAKGLPDGIKIAHKYGREVGVVNDAGIVFSKPPYVVVIMSKNADVVEADGVFPELSWIVYRALSQDR